MTTTPDETIEALPPDDETAVQRAFVLAYRSLARARAHAGEDRDARSRRASAACRTGCPRRRGSWSPPTRRRCSAGRSTTRSWWRRRARRSSCTRGTWSTRSTSPELSDEEIVARVDCDTEYRLHDAAAAGKGGIAPSRTWGTGTPRGRWMKAIGLPAWPSPRSSSRAGSTTSSSSCATRSAWTSSASSDRQRRAGSSRRRSARTGWWRWWRIATSPGAASRSRCSGARVDPRRPGAALALHRRAAHRHAHVHHARRLADRDPRAADDRADRRPASRRRPRSPG